MSDTTEIHNVSEISGMEGKFHTADVRVFPSGEKHDAERHEYVARAVAEGRDPVTSIGFQHKRGKATMFWIVTVEYKARIRKAL